MIMGTPKFDNIKTSVAVPSRVYTSVPSRMPPWQVQIQPWNFLVWKQKKVSNHWQETQENSSEVHDAEQT